MRRGLHIGAYGVSHHLVREDQTVRHILPGSCLERGEPVLATGYLVAILENACWRILSPYLQMHETTVGVDFTLRHTAPALPGDVLHVVASCTEIANSNDVSWMVEARNLRTGEVVGSLRHHSLRVMDRARFHRRLHRL
ncbi:thioesterase family protein [Saccharopolyspora hattusasensis]|uniref:thioesterase family protein n=1 Tax=Saccharopolyspora hattusasensis TaxID=1128679 RepID=UPI003D96D966